MTPSAIRVAAVDTPKNIASSMCHLYFPGVNTNQRFISQQNMLDTMNPQAVANAASIPREAYHASCPVNVACGSPRNRTAKSSWVRHFRHVAAST